MALRESEDIESKDGFFIPTRDVSSSKSSIIMYYLSENGKHSSLVTGIKDDGNAYKFSGDKLLYIDSSDVAHMATLHKDKDHIATRVQLCEKAVKLIATKEECVRAVAHAQSGEALKRERTEDELWVLYPDSTLWDTVKRHHLSLDKVCADNSISLGDKEADAPELLLGIPCLWIE
jgi:hypothetical protein